MGVEAINIEKLNGPLFLFGIPRSGTKLLRDLINQHPGFAIPSVETEFLPGLVNKYSPDYVFDRVKFSDLYQEVLKYPYFNYQVEFNNLVSEDDLYAACNDYRLPGIFEALVRCSTQTEKNMDVMWGDKSPSYISHVHLLKKIYPTVKFIHIVRDVRDYVLSMSKAWGKNKYRAAQRWSESLDKVDNDLASIKPDVFIVRYEDLLDDYANILSEILQFLGLPFDECVLQLESASESLGDTKGEKRVVAGNKGKYKKILSGREIFKIEKLAGPTLNMYGYETVYKGKRKRLYALQEKYYQLLDAISLILFERKNRGTWGSKVFYWNYYRATRGV